MRLVGVVALVAASGCDVVLRLDYIPDAPPGETGSPPVKYIAPGDYDGDGVPNDQDPCPYIAAPAGNVDRDGDHVGDDCDPNPDMPGDCIVLFDGFTEPLDARWSGDGINGLAHYPWTTCTDLAPAYCSPRPAATSWLYFADGIEAARVRVSALVWNHGTPPPENVIQISADSHPQPTDVAGRFCGLALEASGVTIQIDDLPHSLTSAVEHPTQLQYDNQHPLLFDWQPTSSTCTITTSGSAAAVDSIVQTTTETSPGSYVGIRSDHSDIDVSWIIVYGARC